jgi:methyltransferase (TIGR00027 family)
VARTRWIDELFARVLPSVEQVLLLGAGFDTRAYRLPGMAGVQVFEVDHPSTQAAKRRILRRALGQAPGNVRFVPVVFGTGDLHEALAAAEFASRDQTLVLWEGVSNYLDADTVDATFALLSQVTAPGSPFVFTYVDGGIIDGTAPYEGARQTMQRVRSVGEPFTFGIDPDKAASFFSARGFEVLTDVAVSDLVERFYGVPMLGYGYYRVVEARRS